MSTRIHRKTITTINHIADTLLERELNFTTFQLKSFALIVNEEGISVSDLMERAGFNKSTAARVFRTLSTREAPNRAGHGLIQLITDEADYRVRRAYLTPKGTELAIALGFLNEAKQA